MIPKNIYREHILKAIEEIEKVGIPVGRSSKKYRLEFNSKYYPPKYIITLANKYANGNELDSSEFSGGSETNTFLRVLGFKIINEPISDELIPVQFITQHAEKEVVVTSHVREKTDRNKKLAGILMEIPWEVWERIVREEPEWHYMESFLKNFGYGPFAVLMLTAGLNDFQLKGRAEIAYWPKIRNLFLGILLAPKSPSDLCNLFEPLYQKERFNTIKVQRLKRFLESHLAYKLWNSSPQKVSIKFLDIWKELTQTMGQKSQDKTICFAMKCLGISLLMAKEYKFDFTAIPIPVDLRVLRFTQNAGLILGNSDYEIRAVWTDILSLLQLFHSRITMIHLDSLVWQIASLQKNELQTYFERLTMPHIGEHLSAFLQTSVNANLQNAVIKEQKVIEHSNTSSVKFNKKILILFPCSGEKQYFVAQETFDKTQEKSVIDLIRNTKMYLLNGRKGMSSYIDVTSQLIVALDRYNGSLYKADNFKESVKTTYLMKDVHILIMSGAYGILVPSERIHYYERPMNARYWKQNRLPDVIEEYIEKNKITHVYGFFSLTTDYMKIMKSINWQKLRNAYNLEVAWTFYIDFQGTGGAQVVVPQLTGRLIVSFIKSNFSQDNFYTNPFNGQYVRFIDHVATGT